MTSEIEYDRWMTCLSDVLGPVPLNKVCIPGSHDCGTWSIRSLSPWHGTMGVFAQTGVRAFFTKVGAKIASPTTACYSRCQSLDINGQLNAGVRYFDARAAKTTSTSMLSSDGTFSGYRFVHGMLGSDFIAGLEDVQRFCEANPKEIVIVDIRFTLSFDEDDHAHLVQVVEKMFGDRLATRAELSLSPTSTLQEYWDAGANVIVIYHDEREEAQSFWNRGTVIKTLWPNRQKSSDALKYFAEHLEKKKDSYKKLHSFQACLTANSSIILTSPWGGIERLALDLNEKLAQKFRDDELYWSKANIMMVDYPEHHDLVKAIVDANAKRIAHHAALDAADVTQAVVDTVATHADKADNDTQAEEKEVPEETKNEQCGTASE